jgi:ribosome-associated protein
MPDHPTSRPAPATEHDAGDLDDDLPVPLSTGRTLLIPRESLRWAATHASGPGGQNVNKVATKVELRLDVFACDAFTFEQKTRIADRLRNRMADGVVILTSQRTRTRLRNMEDAREKLSALLSEALAVQKARTATKPSRRQKARRLDEKKRNTERKGTRASVRSWDD